MARELDPQVWIFWDMSNTFAPVKYVASRHRENLVDYRVRLYFPGVFHVAHAGRQVKGAYAVGPNPEARFWGHMERLGFTIDRFHVTGHGEQGVDQALQVRMLRTLADVPTPGTVVLLTGDGAGYQEGIGFYSDLERMHKGGWGVEVVSWGMVCNRYLRAWAERVGEFIELERYYRQITFVEGGRRPEILNLKGRPRALPGRGNGPSPRDSCPSGGIPVEGVPGASVLCGAGGVPGA